MAKLTSFLEGGSRQEMLIRAIAIDASVSVGGEYIIYPYVIKLTCWLLGIEPNMTEALWG